MTRAYTNSKGVKVYEVRERNSITRISEGKITLMSRPEFLDAPPVKHPPVNFYEILRECENI